MTGPEAETNRAVTPTRMPKESGTRSPLDGAVDRPVRDIAQLSGWLRGSPWPPAGETAGLQAVPRKVTRTLVNGR